MFRVSGQLPRASSGEDRIVRHGYGVGPRGHWYFFEDIAPALAFGRAARMALEVRILNRYLARVLRAAERHPEVALAFHRVVNLTAAPDRLFAPAMLRKVFS